jgi:hypothetical protein
MNMSQTMMGKKKKKVFFSLTSVVSTRTVGMKKERIDKQKIVNAFLYDCTPCPCLCNSCDFYFFISEGTMTLNVG